MQNILLKFDRQMSFVCSLHTPMLCTIKFSNKSVHINKSSIANGTRSEKESRSLIWAQITLNRYTNSLQIKSATQIDTNSIISKRPCLSSACKWILWRLQNKVHLIWLYNKPSQRVSKRDRMIDWLKFAQNYL